MAIRIPFFGALTLGSPMNGLLEHYELIAKGMKLVEESMECFVSGGGEVCRDLSSIHRELDAVEEHADTIKRHIRNHLPRGLFLPVEKHLFFSYTRAQDDVLNAGQQSLEWLAIRDIALPENFREDFVLYLSEVSKCVLLLKPALEGTILLVNGEFIERTELKNHFKATRLQHKAVIIAKHTLTSAIYNEDLEFKDIYQLIHFVDTLYKMSHSTEKCVDLLRVMIAK